MELSHLGNGELGDKEYFLLCFYCGKLDFVSELLV